MFETKDEILIELSETQTELLKVATNLQCLTKTIVRLSEQIQNAKEEIEDSYCEKFDDGAYANLKI